MSIMPECGRHDYPLLLQKEAVLNGEFLAEVPVVVECFRALFPGRRPPLHPPPRSTPDLENQKWFDKLTRLTNIFRS